MNCCPLSSADFDDPSFSTTVIRTARKTHRCNECHQTIPAGSKYECVTGCWDGQMSRFKTCMLCVEIRDHFACDGWIIGRLWQDLEENFLPDMKAGGPCMEGLSPEAKGRLFEAHLDYLEGL